MPRVGGVLFRALGPVDVVTDDGPVAVAAAKERTLLALLLADANRVVPAARLIDELWGERVPRSATKTLQTYVSHLRRLLADRLITDPAGYVLRVRPEEFDVSRFERGVADGRLAILRGECDAGRRLLDGALALWRGDAYTGVWSETLIRAESVRLAELRLGATEDLIEVRLAGGEHMVLVAELEALVARHPERERLWGLLMIALDRGGRQADALRVFQRARAHLVDEIGIEPGPELSSIERAILRRDTDTFTAALSAPAATYVENEKGHNIAYWTTGSGSRDVVFCAEIFHNLELLRDLDEMWAFLEPLAREARLIAVQRRGTGLSDRDADSVLAPPQECVGDIDAVLDAVGSSRVSLVGWGHGGQLALAYAAARPDRVHRVAVVNSYARLAAARDYPDGLPTDFLDAFSDSVERTWGTYRRLPGIFDPRTASNPDVIRRMSRIERLVATPREAAALRRALDNFDIRPLLPDVGVPVLVLFLTGSLTGAAGARWLAEHLPAAEYVEAPGYFVPSVTDAAVVASIVNRFLQA